ncbi:MAG: hypothetical protein ACYCSA_06075 [Thermoplasmataceae archaeon]
MQKRNEFTNKLIDSVADATSTIVRINEKLKGTSGTGRDQLDYEHTLVAQIYHQLLNRGIDELKLRLELKPDVEPNDLKNKHIDLWYYDQENASDFLIEVKQISKLVYDNTAISSTDIYNSDGTGIVADILKLDNICREIRKDGDKIKGIMIVSYVNAREKPAVDYNEIIHQFSKKAKEVDKSFNGNDLSLILSFPRGTKLFTLS